MSPTATIGTIRLRSRGRSDVTQRLRWEARLARADLDPPSLPPAAILIVRSLRGPAGTNGTNDWGELRRELDGLHRRAARPGRERDPGAPAVVFESEAELAACFAMDAVDRVVSDRWWWRHVGMRPGAGPATSFAAYLAERPRCVPEAIVLLADAGYLVAAAGLLTPTRSTAVLHSVAREFELDLLPAIDDAQSTAATSARSPAPPWRDWLPQSRFVEDLAPETCLLVATAYGLARAPHAVRSKDYASQVAEWLVRRPESPSRLPNITVEPAEAPDSGSADAADVAVAGPSAPADDRSPLSYPPDATAVRGGEARKTSRPEIALEPRRDKTRSPTADTTRLAMTRVSSATERLSAEAGGASVGQTPIRESILAGSDVASAMVLPAADPHRTSLAVADPAGIPTSLAGAFFLVNLLLRLHPSGRAGKESTSLEALGAWDALESITLGMLGSLPDVESRWQAWGADPLWPQLAQLGGRRPGDRLGHELPLGPTHQIPEAWCDGVARGPTWRVPPVVAPRFATGLRHWLARVIPCLRGQMAAAIGTDPDAAIRLVMLRDGRLYVTGTHVDVVMALDSVSGEVRRAGLDIDPGWQPRYGRVIRFEYR